MKIVLIATPITASQHIESARWLKVTPRIHPLGLGYIAAYLEQYGYQVRIIDANSEDLNDEQIVQRIHAWMPDIVGFSATTPAFIHAKRIMTKIKKQFENIKILLGGAHVTAVPEDAILHCDADIGVRGEGEKTVYQIIRHYENNGDPPLSEIKGIVYRHIDKAVKTDARGYWQNIDEIPFPARHLMLPLKKLQPVPASFKYLPSTHLMTSRGCPSLCTFCDRAIFGTKCRAANPIRVVDEIEEIVHKYGARDYKFFDDTFTFNKNRVYEICDEIVKRKLDKIPWACLTKVNSVDFDLLRYMKRSGCWQVLYGLESGDDRMLELLRKGNTVKDNRNAVIWADKAGLNVRADFIVGTPGETIESLDKTLNFALSLPLGYAHFNKFIPLPGTELYRRLIKKRGKNDFYNYNESTSSITAITTIEFVPEGLDPEVYRMFLVYAHKKFYLRPRYIFKRLMSISSWDQLKGQIYGALAIIDL